MPLQVVSFDREKKGTRCDQQKIKLKQGMSGGMKDGAEEEKEEWHQRQVIT